MPRAKPTGKNPSAKKTSRQRPARIDPNRLGNTKTPQFLGSKLRDGLCQELAGISFNCQSLIQKMESSEHHCKSLARVCDMVLAALAEARTLADELDATPDQPD